MPTILSSRIANEVPALPFSSSERPSSVRLVSIKDTLAGVVTALSDLSEWAGVFAFSDLEQRILFRREPPFAADPGEGPRIGRALRDLDLDRIRHWFEEVLGARLTKANIGAAVRLVASRHAFHPVRDYLCRVQWDGVARIDGWLERYAAVRPASEEHARLLRSVSSKWLLSCVARAMVPGSKVDTVLILEGQQGIGKSTALATLAGEGFFCDSAIDFATREACLQVQGVWIYELAEVATLLKGETPVIKGFLSRSWDRYRAPYGRAVENVPRSVVFCGTVNHTSYLRDRTGNRRFWTVRCEGPLDVTGLASMRDALWAEARVRYEAGEAWHLSRNEDALMHAEHEDRLEVDPLDEVLTAWTASLGDRPFTMNEVLEAALGRTAQRQNPHVTSRVSHALERLGFERRKRSAIPRTYYYARRATLS